MADDARINVRFNDPEILEKLAELAKKNDNSVNQFASKIIENYIKCSDNYVLDALPMIVKSMVREELKSLEQTQIEIMKDIYQTIIKLRTVTETLVTFLSPEYQKIEYDSLKAEQLLALLTAIEKDKSGKK